MEKCVAFRVGGRVQGVFFRASCKQKADELGLVGWVRNRPDGDVEGVACGSDEQLSKFRSWLEQGPPMANVEKLEFEPCETSVYDKFQVR